MAKSKPKTNDRNDDPAKCPEIEFIPAPLSGPMIERDMLFELYLARVAKAETVNTMRRDAKAIFRDAYFEAKVALDVYLELAK